MSLLLPACLTLWGPLEVGVLAATTQLGPTALTGSVGMAEQRFGRQERSSLQRS